MEAFQEIKSKIEFGDFQTPFHLALSVVKLTQQFIDSPNLIVEPTCGVGAFVLASQQIYPNTNIIGFEINKESVKKIKDSTNHMSYINIHNKDFFEVDWEKEVLNDTKNILIIGNYPWVTNSAVGSLEGTNLPIKSNFNNLKGIKALTGNGNFDISEWMLIKSLTWLQTREGVLSMICKTAVARKLLLFASRNDFLIDEFKIYNIDSCEEFGVSVDACVLIVRVSKEKKKYLCLNYSSLDEKSPISEIGVIGNQLVSNIVVYNRNKHLSSIDLNYTWRSGIKHDCSKVMELKYCGQNFQNGLGEILDLEKYHIYPLLKSSDVSGNIKERVQKFLIVTQYFMNQNSMELLRDVPKMLEYLESHIALFNKRKSSIYKNKGAFAIFGVGSYTFKPWKVAISGFYKSLNFRVFGPVNNKPIVFDDTVYFLSFNSQEEATFVSNVLNSEISKELLNSLIFWDEKRPITIEKLKKLNIRSIAVEIGLEGMYNQYNNYDTTGNLFSHL